MTSRILERGSTGTDAQRWSAQIRHDTVLNMPRMPRRMIGLLVGPY